MFGGKTDVPLFQVVDNFDEVHVRRASPMTGRIGLSIQICKAESYDGGKVFQEKPCRGSKESRILTTLSRSPEDGPLLFLWPD